ncbi:MAG: glycosyltransferase family 39 protein [Bacteroidetes bacterium]|nr:glycosyltransferase family 39 protein [Bacteroidota bacterium]
MMQIHLTHTGRKAIIYLFAVAFILFFGNHWVSLWDQDEAAYAGFAKTMVESGNWLMPEFMWSEVHRKPPLHFWNIAISYKLFGINEFAVRFPSALFVLLTLILVFFGTRKILGERESFISIIVISTSFLVMSLAKVSVTDATLLFFTTLCAISILHVLLYRTKKWIFLFWIGFSMALLTKGPPVILFSGCFVFILFLLHPQRKNLLLLHPWFFLPLAVLPIYYWGYLCNQTPEGKVFIQWMIDWYILKRVGGSVFGQTGPPGTHLIGLLLFFLPYFVVFPRAIYDGISGLFKKEKSTHFLLAAWFISGWFIYELTPSKLPAYVIAAHIPLSFLIARILLQEKISAFLLQVHIILNALIFLVLIAAPLYFGFSNPIKITFFIVGFIFFIAKLLLLRFGKRTDFLKYLLTINVAFQFSLWCILLPVADELKNSSLRIARQTEKMADRNTPVIIANNNAHPPSLPFYLQMRFKQVSEEYDNEKLLKLYQAGGCVLILNTEQKNHLSNFDNQLKFTEIKPIFTDRIQQDVYFIVAPGLPQKQF